MTTKTSPRSKRVLAFGLLAPLALTIAACESDTTISILENGDARMTMEIHDTDGILEMGGLTSCDDFMEDFVGSEDDYTVEDISSGGHLGCRITVDSYGSVVDGETLKETDSTYIFEVPADEAADELGSDDLDMLAAMGFGFTFNIEMPGDIIQADGAQISGNRATYDDPNALTQGIYVEGYKSGSGTAPTTDDPTTDDPTTDDPTTNGSERIDPTDTTEPGTVSGEPAGEPGRDDGFPVWAWVLIGVALSLIHI